MYRIAVVADSHCGHMLGLTPPAWRVSARVDSRLHRAQNDMWRRYSELVEHVVRPPVDVLFTLGDLVEGPQSAFRGVELVEPDVLGQCEMAAQVLRMMEARTVYMVRGSLYHVGEAEEFEDVIAKELGADIANEMLVRVDKVTFHLEHFVGRSSIVHGRATPLARDWLVNVLLASHGAMERAQVILRGHVHYHAYVGGTGWLAMAVPALCYGGGKIRRRVKGMAEFGLVVFEVDGGEFRWVAEATPVVHECAVVREVRPREAKS
ncbi:MAG: hypothetical protein QXU79_00315 [Candidatus Micrarchaeaceae archaeon]